MNGLGTQPNALKHGTRPCGATPAVNAGATFSIPTENQWYRVAYYKNVGYWNYATQSDLAPTALTAGWTGIGYAGSTGNFANYLSAADWNSQNGNVTTVGTNGEARAYGAFDMSGNVHKWNDLTGAADSFRGLRGGSWSDFFASAVSSSVRGQSGPSSGDTSFGFRLASPVLVPGLRLPTMPPPMSGTCGA